MPAELDNPAFQDDDLAREWFEARIWPNGPVCPHCGSFGEGVTRMLGQAHRPGSTSATPAAQQFTVTVGTVMERSKIPLHIWLKAMYLLATIKEGDEHAPASSDARRQPQIDMVPDAPYPGGDARAVSRDANGRSRPAGAGRRDFHRTTHDAGRRSPQARLRRQRAGHHLVDGKQARSFHVPEVNGATLKPILREQISPGGNGVHRRGHLLPGHRRRFPCRSLHRPAQHRRIRARRRDGKRVRELLFDPQSAASTARISTSARRI